MTRHSWLTIALILAVPAVGWCQDDEKKSPRLPISRTQASDFGGVLRSEHVRSDGTHVLHGLQVIFGPLAQMKEYCVFNDGRCEQLVQLYPNGKQFRVQWRDHNGDGTEVIYTAASNKVIADKVIVGGGQDIGPVKVQDEVCVGRVKAEQCWEGKFLIRELRGFKSELELHEYKDGKLIASKPFPLEPLELPADEATEEKWRWTFPDWPKSPDVKKNRP